MVRSDLEVAIALLDHCSEIQQKALSLLKRSSRSSGAVERLRLRERKGRAFLVKQARILRQMIDKHIIKR